MVAFSGRLPQMQIRLNKLNEKRVKLRVKAHGGTPTLIANMVLSAVFEAEEKEVRKRAADLCGVIANKMEAQP